MGRLRWLRRIEELDPVADHEEIYRISAGYEFPWDYQRALELALFRTYCVPSISVLLDATGEFRDRPQRRYDDTALLMGELAAHGYDSPRGKEALRVINRMHGRYAIANDDMLYVLSTFVVTPLRWLDAFGWRPLHPHERIATVAHYRALGRRMGIRDMPGDEDGFAGLMDRYEAEHFAFTPGGREVADATLALLTTFPPFSALPAATVRRLTTCLMDPHLLTALRYAVPTRPERAAVRAGMRVRALVERHLPPRTEMISVDDLAGVRSYPGGFDLARLGTFG